MFKCEINRHSGFTLVELVLVILLLGILSVVAMGKMFDGNQFKARGFFDDTVTAVRFAQKLAVSTGCRVQVQINASGYQLFQGATCSSNTFSTRVKNPANRNNDYFNAGLPNGYSLTSAAITFNPRGVIDSGTNTVVTLSGGSTSRSFTVYGKTGLVQ